MSSTFEPGDWVIHKDHFYVVVDERSHRSIAVCREVGTLHHTYLARIDLREYFPSDEDYRFDGSIVPKRDELYKVYHYNRILQDKGPTNFAVFDSYIDNTKTGTCNVWFPLMKPYRSGNIVGMKGIAYLSPLYLEPVTDPEDIQAYQLAKMKL